MENRRDIVAFQPSDGLDPIVMRKLNHNFSRLGLESQRLEVTLSDEIGSVPSSILYASSPVVAGNADRSNAILYGSVDPSSTSKVFTATVPGLTELYHGVAVLLRNGVVTSASGFTVNVNGLGAKPVYTNLAAATAETTKFNVNYTMLFVYDESRVSGGCWVCYNGYDSNTNTIGYQVRTASSTLPAADYFARYRLLFTGADGASWVPATTSNSTNATAVREVNSRPIDPFGPIVYYSATGAINPGGNPSAGSLWQQYTLTLGYSFNTTGAALQLSYPDPVYLKCEPLADGSAVMEGIVQALPQTADGKIYILLGMAYSATAIELRIEHPVYEYRDGSARQWMSIGYGALSGKPSIESVTLVGNKTFPDLNIFIDPDDDPVTDHPASDGYALGNAEITALWNAAM